MSYYLLRRSRASVEPPAVISNPFVISFTACDRGAVGVIVERDQQQEFSSLSDSIEEILAESSSAQDLTANVHIISEE